MIYLEESTSNISTLIENQFPNFVQENNSKFISFLTNYYQSQELKYQPLDIVTNIIDYYNISYFKPSQLVESTKTSLQTGGDKDDDVITVDSTVGFPRSGFIKIDSEIIFYENKTDTTFKECTRGTSALILKSIPKSNLILNDSVISSHKSGSVVTNISFNYANEFLSRIKSELATLLPEVLDDSLDISSFISKIKSFYSAKGSLNSHRILFKILFNDKKFNIKLKPRGSGAKLGINNFGGSIEGVVILNGGVNYDSRKNDSNELINSPIVDIFGTGVGKKVGDIIPDKSAVIEVTNINTSGVITEVTVKNKGELYRGSINSRVRPRNFKTNEIVYNVSKTGSGRVEFFDPKLGELILTDVVGYFSPNEEILTDEGEKARGFIAKSFDTPVSSRTGLIVQSEEQSIEFPKDYTFKTSNSKFTSKKFIRCKLLDGYTLPDGKLPEIFNLKQNPDKLFGVSGIEISTSESFKVDNNVYEFDVSTNNSISKLYLPSSTVITKEETGITNSSTEVVITVDDASGFPFTNGIIFVNGVEVLYKFRSVNQFFECKYSGSSTLNLNVKDEVLSIGRIKIDDKWQSNTEIKKGTYKSNNNNLYVSENDGTTGSISPTHTSGIEYDGDQTVLWRYVDTNRYDYTLNLELENFENPKFQVLALPGELIVEESGALYTQSNNTFNFVDNDSPNIKVYNFTTNEISDRLSLVLATNFNKDRNVVSDNRFPSHKSLTGFLTQHDYEEYIYVPSSAIPPWWSTIVDTSGSNEFSTDDKKKVAFTNQKLLARWKKSGLIFETQSVSEFTKTKKAIGLNIDAIQLNSYKGNTVEYGYIDKIFIGDGGNYPVLYSENASTKIAESINDTKNPLIGIVASTLEESAIDQINLDNTSKFTKISASIKKINFTKIYNYFDSLVINDEDIVIGKVYKIISVGTTDFTSFGASENTVGTIFTAIKNGDSNNNGTGTVISNPLENFTKKPNIDVINNNPQIVLNFTDYFNDNATFDEVKFNNHGLETSDEITFISNGNYFKELISNTKYFVRKINNNLFALYKTNTDALLNDNRVSLDVITLPTSTVTPNIESNTDNFGFRFEKKQQNPLDFEEAILELSYKNNKIDNIIIKNSGKGYINLPSILISGGGLETPINIPFSVNKDVFVELEGPIVSYHNFDNKNFNIIENFNTINQNYSVTPSLKILTGEGAEAASFVSNGKLGSITLINPGNFYNSVPKIEVIGNGQDAVVEAIINDTGNLIGFNIINEGSGYTFAPQINIIPADSKGSITAKLNEWTFNLVRELNYWDRIDDYGGYVYDSGDSIPIDISDPTKNQNKFKLIDYRLDLPDSEDQKQYHLIQNADKLLARHIRDKKDITGTDAQVIAAYTHSPAIAISYDGIPIYGANRVNSDRTKPSTDAGGNNPLEEIKSRYKFKYSTTSSGFSGEQSVTIGGTTYYINRIGGPSLTAYPIGTFIEDYEFVEGDNDALDIHNGRFSITPEFPAGRYVYYATRESFDTVTNTLITNQGVSFNGFPYFIGDTFAGEYDTYMNSKCRTNDKIPSRFTRIFEKKVDASSILNFSGIDPNEEYPSENNNRSKTVFSVDKVTPGSVDSIIIENKGDNYRVGDRLKVDNDRTFGSGFSAFVSKVGGKNITKIENSADDQYKKIIFYTNETHGLIINDYVYFDYTPMKTSDTYIEVNLHGITDSQPGKTVSGRLTKLSNLDLFLRPDQDIDTFKDKEIYSLPLNSKHIYNLRLKTNSSFKLTYDIESVNEYFTLEESPADTITLNAQKIPNKLYLHMTAGDTLNAKQYIYEINIVKDYFGLHKVSSIDNTNNTFTVTLPESSEFYEKENIFYTVKSFGVSGPIEEISISSKGYNYRRLPVITGLIKKGTIDTPAGNGEAIIQADSNTIGKLKNIKYSSIGTNLVSNKNVNYYVNTPATAKVINNFEIYEVEIISGGQNYSNVVTLTASVNNQSSSAKFEVEVFLGTIVKVKVIDRGSNFNEEPVITISSESGSGAVLKAKIRRKNLTEGTIIKGIPAAEAPATDLFPVQVETKVINFDPDNSTLQFDEFIGQFDENDVMFTPDGEVYGKIVNIKRSKVYAKVSPSTSLNFERSDISGNTSEYLQKITDSSYYQDWSYSIISTRDTKEWKNNQKINTHPAGFKQFGKKKLETRKSFFDNPSDVFKGNVIFTTALSDKKDLNLKKATCSTQKILFSSQTNFIIGKYYYGVTSGAMGQVIDIGETFVEFLIINEIKFVLGELIIQVEVNFDGSQVQHTTKLLSFVNGILQELNESYITASLGSSIQFIPKFEFSNVDLIVLNQSTTDYDVMDTNVLPAGSTFFNLKKNNVVYPITDGIKEQFIISIAGAVQKTDDIGTIGNNTVTFSNPLEHESKIFAFRNTKLNKLTFTGSGTTYQLNHTPSSNCQLLIFTNGVNQSHLTPLNDYTISGNTITLVESVNQTDIFGWYIDETSSCSVEDPTTINNNKSLFISTCNSQNFKQLIESNTSKKPRSIFELRSEQIDGTLHPANNGTRIDGIDTRFTYTSPSHSSSYVEVLDVLDFDSSTTTFTLKCRGKNYLPSNGKESLIVYLENTILDTDDYTVSGSNITFTTAYPTNQECTIIDFVSSFSSNTNNESGSVIDRLNVSQNGSKTTFNLSDRGVPKYVKNIADIFNVKDGALKIPSNSYLDHRNVTLKSHTISGDKITFETAPSTTEDNKLIYFNRQLLPEPSKNVILDRFACTDGIKTSFPLTVDGVVQSGIIVNNLFVVISGVIQKAGTDYTVSTGVITFSTAPLAIDDILLFYSYNGLDQNIMLDSLTGINGSQTTHGLYNSGVSFTPPSVDDLMVSRNGVIQNPTQDFTVSGSNITFTTALQTTDSVFVLYTHGSEELTISSSSAVSSSVHKYTLSSALSSNDEDNVIIYADGAPRFHSRGDFTIENSNTELHLTHTDGIVPVSIFVVKYQSITLIDNPNSCPDGIETKFPLLYNNANLTASNIVSEADILVSINGIVQHPGDQYTLTTNRAQIQFDIPPQHNDEVFMVRMLGNSLINLTNVSGNQYTVSSPQTTEKENVIVFSNNTWKFEELGDFTWNNNSTITLNSAHTTGNLFAIKFYGVVNLLDQFNTPFNNTNTNFNLMDGNEYFLPPGTIADDSVPHESSILVVKNGKILEPGVEYTLVGDNKSQIQFTTAPSPSDIISVRCVGSFDKLDTLTNKSGKTFTIKKSNVKYYADADIARPRDLENQILVIKDGEIQSPLYDYHITLSKNIKFNSNVTFTKLVILDFRGTPKDVKVHSRNNQVSVGDEITLEGENSRIVTAILSPTTLETELYSGPTPVQASNLSVSFSNGSISSITVGSGGSGYVSDTTFRTIGSGTGAVIGGKINLTSGGNVVSTEIIDPGHNIFASQTVIPTVDGKVYKKQPLHSTEVRKATKLSSNINSSVETIPLDNTANILSNAPSVVVSQTGNNNSTPSGSGAQFKLYISGGELRKIDIVSAGSGYDDRETTIALSGGGGSGCVLEPVIDGSGAFTAVNIKNPGIGYDTFRVIINNEIIEYTNVSSNQIDGCTRGVAGTTAASHSAQIESPDDASTYTLVYFDNYL